MEKLGIDVKLLLAQLVNFGLFFFIFHKFIAKPFMNFIKNEQKKDKEKEKILADLEHQKTASEKRESESREKMNKEIREELAKAKKEAEMVKKDLISEAKKEASAIVSQARKQMDDEARQMEESMKKRVADLSVVMVRQGLKSYLNEETQKEVTREILTNIKN